MAISDEAIQAIAAAGFDVYQREPGDTYLLFTDGQRIGYMQENRFSGLSLHTVHIPNKTTGTGFSVAEDLGRHDLTRDKLSEAFILAPFRARDVQTVRKWKDFATFQAANSFNAGYLLVAKAEG